MVEVMNLAVEMPPTPTFASLGRPGDQAYFATFVLFSANVVSFLDRQILSLLVQPIKVALGLSDGAIGLMQGGAFVLTYALAGLTIGRFIDQRSRRNILLICILIFSVSSSLSGLAQHGWQLFIGRMGVGVGEAALIPTALSLLADLFPVERRGKPYGFFTTGVYVGMGLSLLLVGAALPWAGSASRGLLARGIALAPWQLIMLSMLIPGLAVCALLLTLREPVRLEAAKANDASVPSGLRAWTERWNFFLPHHLFVSLATLCPYAIMAWMPSVLIREYKLPMSIVGLTFGLTVLASGICSALFGGFLVDRAARTGGPTGRLRLAQLFLVIGLIGFGTIYVAHSLPMIIIGSAVSIAAFSVCMMAGVMAMSDFSPSASRARIATIFYLFSSVIGNAGGPGLVGFANDWFGGSARPLSAILCYVGGGATLIALSFSWLTVRAAGRPLHSK